MIDIRKSKNKYLSCVWKLCFSSKNGFGSVYSEIDDGIRLRTQEEKASSEEMEEQKV